MNKYLDFSLATNRNRVFWIVLHLMLVSAAIGVQRTILSLFTERFDNFNSSVLAAAITLSVFGVTKSLGNFFGGLFSDIRGRKVISLLGNLSLIAGTLGILLLHNLSGFVIGNIFVGIGTGLVFVAATILLTDLASMNERSTAVSFMELSVYFGTALGSIITFNLEISEDNLIPYIISGVMLLGGVLLLFLTMKDTSKFIREESKIEKEESHVTEVLEMFSKEYGVFKEVDPAGTRIDRRYYLKKTFQVVLGTGIVTRIIDSLIVIILPLMLISIGLTTSQYSVVSTVYLLAWSAGITLSIRITRRYGRKLPIIVGLLIQSFGVISFTFSTDYPVLIAAGVAAGLGLGIYYPLPGSIVTDIVPAEKRGQAVGMFRLFLDFGYFIGSAIWVLSTDFLYEQVHDRLIFLRSYSTYSFSFLIGSTVLLVHASLVFLLLKDTRPIWKQKPIVLEHFENVSMVFRTIKDAAGKNLEQAKLGEVVRKAKVFERKADDYLDHLTLETYAGSFPLIDSYDILRFSTRVDKAAGHIIRSMRKLEMVKSPLPDSIATNIENYLVILDVLVESLKEALKFLSIGISISVFRSYQVSTIEEVLDEIYRILWSNLNDCASDLDAFELLVLKDTIDSLEKSANTIDDASELLRIIAFKHMA